VAPTLDHIDLVVSDLDRSLDFYRGLLRPLGWTWEGEIVGEQGERVVYLGGEPPNRPVAVSLRQSRSHQPHDRYALGIHHVAFGAPSRDAVDDRARWLRETGAELESEPREYDYTPGYYAVFFFDPDALKLEIVYKPD
jgi:catechol 2,3-dioxygenase-like lactoylglutathione lyase family enzyme